LSDFCPGSCRGRWPDEEALPEYDTFVPVPLLVQVRFVNELPESESAIGDPLFNPGGPRLISADFFELKASEPAAYGYTPSALL
jgi:hypothetical protein